MNRVLGSKFRASGMGFQASGAAHMELNFNLIFVPISKRFQVSGVRTKAPGS